MDYWKLFFDIKIKEGPLHQQLQKNWQFLMFSMGKNAYTFFWWDYLTKLPIQTIVSNSSLQHENGIQIRYNIRMIMFAFMLIEMQEKTPLSGVFVEISGIKDIKISSNKEQCKSEVHKILQDLIRINAVNVVPLSKLDKYAKMKTINRFYVCDDLVSFAMQKILSTYGENVNDKADSKFLRSKKKSQAISQTKRS